MSEAARWMLLLGLILIEPAQSLAVGAPESVAFTIRVDNYTSLDRKTQLRAEKAAEVIFRKAGVAIGWLDVGHTPNNRQAYPSEQTSFDPSKMWLLILSSAMANSLSLPGGVMGLAPGDGADRQHVYVFYDRVTELSRKQIDAYYKGTIIRPASADQILGAMIAHEIGHVLLKLPRHTATGIMRGDWDLKDLEDIAYGALLFTPQQAEAIRAEIARRIDKSHAVEVAGP